MDTISFSTVTAAIYCRKSGEDKNRQILSLPAQKDEAQKLVSYHGIKRTVLYEEAKSARFSGNRSVFSGMVRDIRRGKVNAIICWKIDRLARNMVEAGEIIELLQRGIIRAIITPGKVYYPKENAILMAFEFAAANQYSIELSGNILRGQEKKANLGYPPSLACIGFINNKTGEKGTRKWLVDKQRFPIIKKLFTMYLSGNYSGGRLHDWAVHTAKLTTVTHKKIGGKLISRAAIYRLLRNPIYAGIFYVQGTRYELSKELPRIITEAEHHRIIRMLGDNDAPKTQTHEVVYSGYITSPYHEHIGADVKMQLVCDCKHKFSYLNKTHCPKCNTAILHLKQPKYKYYVYYRNIGKVTRKEPFKCISENQITDALTSYISNNLLLSPQLIDWCIKYFQEFADEETAAQRAVFESALKRKKELEDKKIRYREMLADGLSSQAEYLADVEKINTEIGTIELSMEDRSQWLAKACEMVSIGAEMVNTLGKGTVAAQRAVLSRFTSNLQWNEKMLIILNPKPIIELIDGLNRAKSLNSLFEPQNTLADQDKTGVFASVCHELRNTCDNVRRFLVTPQDVSTDKED